MGVCGIFCFFHAAYVTFHAKGAKLSYAKDTAYTTLRPFLESEAPLILGENPTFPGFVVYEVNIIQCSSKILQ